MAEYRVFRFCAFYQPTEEEEKQGKRPEMIVPSGECVASDAQVALVFAARRIPDGYLDKLDSVRVVVSPF